MSDVSLVVAKKRLSELVARVEAGEEIAITRRRKVVALLVPPASYDAVGRARDAVAALRRAREGVSIGRLRSGDLIRAGRR